MSTILVTPKGAEIMAYPHSIGEPKIFFPDLNEWEQMDLKVARANGENRIAPKDFEERVYYFQEAEKIIDLAKGGQLRLGVGVIPLVNNFIVFRQFDPTHPTRPNHLSPPSGIFESGDPWASAWKELCEELIPVGPSGVGLWENGDLDPNPKRSEQFAKDHGLELSNTKIKVDKLFYKPFPQSVFIQFGKIKSSFGLSLYFYALIEFEPDTSSIEILFPVKINLPEGWKIVDGEQYPDGSWCEQPIIAIPPLTSKAKASLRFFCEKAL